MHPLSLDNLDATLRGSNGRKLFMRIMSVGAEKSLWHLKMKRKKNGVKKKRDDNERWPKVMIAGWSSGRYE